MINSDCWKVEFIVKFAYRSSTRNHLDRVTLKQHRLLLLTERPKILLKPQTYHPSLDSTLLRTFLQRKRRLWHQIDPMTTKVGEAKIKIVAMSANHNIIFSENEKETDSRSGPATQGMIQRRRRPKRRSTGVVHVDMEVNKLSNVHVWQVLTHELSHTRTLIRTVIKIRLWTMVTTKSWWVRNAKCLRIVFNHDCNKETVSPVSWP